MNRKTTWALACGFLMAAFALAATAAPIKIAFTYTSGTATAVGTVTLESTLLPNPGANVFALPDPAVIDIQMTVSGAAAGNGTFTTADFGLFVWDTGGGTLNLALPLVGQPTPGGPWGFGGGNGDFNFIGIAIPTPSGVAPFVLRANGGTADSMTLAFAGAAAAAPVPALDDWSLLVLVLLVAGFGIMTARGLRA